MPTLFALHPWPLLIDHLSILPLTHVLGSFYVLREIYIMGNAGSSETFSLSILDYSTMLFLFFFNTMLNIMLFLLFFTLTSNRWGLCIQAPQEVSLCLSYDQSPNE